MIALGVSRRWRNFSKKRGRYAEALDAAAESQQLLSVKRSRLRLRDDNANQRSISNNQLDSSTIERQIIAAKVTVGLAEGIYCLCLGGIHDTHLSPSSLRRSPPSGCGFCKPFFDRFRYHRPDAVFIVRTGDDRRVAVGDLRDVFAFHIELLRRRKKLDLD